MAAILKLSENQTSEHGTIFSIFGRSDFGVPLYYSSNCFLRVKGNIFGVIYYLEVCLCGDERKKRRLPGFCPCDA